MSYPAPPPASSASDASTTPTPGGFFNDLFDVRFTRFVSLRLISVVYVLILVLVSLGALAVIFTGFANGAGPGLFTLIVALIGWVVYVVLARVVLEAFAVLFRIHDDTSRVAEALAGSRSATPPASGPSSPSAPSAPPATPGGTGAGSVTGYPSGYGTTQAYPSQGYGSTPPPATPGSAPNDPAGPPWT